MLLKREQITLKFHKNRERSPTPTAGVAPSLAQLHKRNISNNKLDNDLDLPVKSGLPRPTLLQTRVGPSLPRPNGSAAYEYIYSDKNKKKRSTKDIYINLKQLILMSVNDKSCDPVELLKRTPNLKGLTIDAVYDKDTPV